VSTPPGRLSPHEGAADRLLDRLLEMCGRAAGDAGVPEVRQMLATLAGDVAPLSPAVVVGVPNGDGAPVLASTSPDTEERFPLDPAQVGQPEPGEVRVVGEGASRAAFTPLGTCDDGCLLLGGRLTEELGPAEADALGAVGRLGGTALRVAHERRRGERATATAEQLIEAGITLASHLSLDEVLRRLVELAREVLGARYAALGVLNPARSELERFVTSGLTAEQVAGIGPPPRGRGILGMLITDPRPVRIRDMAQDDRSCGFPEGHPPMNSFLGVPISLRGEVFGNLYVTEKLSADEFSEDDVRLAQTLAAQAAVAVDNARRYEAERRRVVEIESVQEVARAILSTLDLDELLPLIVRRARRLTGADTVGVALGDFHEARFRFAHGVDALAMESLAVPGTPADAAARLRDALGAEVVVEPLEVGGDRIGVLAAVLRSHLDDTSRRLLSTLASQASIAIANAETFAQERRRLRESAQVQAAEARASAAAEGLRQAIEAQEAERARVARELHDEAGQSLTALALNLRTLEEHLDDEGRRRLAQLRQMVNGISSSLRNLATDLRPSGLREHGLASAIERQAARLREATGIAVDVLVSDLPDDLPEEVQIALFRVVQEALTNVARHSGAGQASIVVSRHGGRIRVVVEDDGRGFDLGLPSTRLGLPGIRERVELLGGTLRIESAPEAGTAVIVDLEDQR
jgi:signal transduction histidine kinase